MKRQCDECGTEYVAASPRSRYCTDRCRKRAARRGRPRMAAVTALAARPTTGTALEDATRDFLAAVGRESTPLGLAAVELARVLSDPATSPSALPGLAKQLEAALTSATKGATTESNPLADIRARRDAKRRTQ